MFHVKHFGRMEGTDIKKSRSPQALALFFRLTRQLRMEVKPFDVRV